MWVLLLVSSIIYLATFRVFSEIKLFKDTKSVFYFSLIKIILKHVDVLSLVSGTAEFMLLLSYKVLYLW